MIKSTVHENIHTTAEIHIYKRGFWRKNEIVVLAHKKQTFHVVKKHENFLKKIKYLKFSCTETHRSHLRNRHVE